MSWRIGVDIGGTFTDVAVVNEKDGTIGVTKVSSTPGNFGQAVLIALEQALSKFDIEVDRATFEAIALPFLSRVICLSSIFKAIPKISPALKVP